MNYHCYQISEWGKEPPGRTVHFQITDPNEDATKSAQGNVSVSGAGANNEILKAYDVGEDYAELPEMNGVPV